MDLKQTLELLDQPRKTKADRSVVSFNLTAFISEVTLAKMLHRPPGSFGLPEKAQSEDGANRTDNNN